MSEKYKLRRGGTWYPLATFYEIEQHELKIADNTQSGHVIIGDNIQLDNDGTISVKNASVEDVGVVQIVDNLTTDDDTKVLSAKQGYELKQLIDNIDTSGGGTGSDIVVEDSFTSTSVINALSANKGRELKVLIDTKASQSDLETLEATVDSLAIGSGNVTQAEKDSWNAKSDFSGDFLDLLNKPTIPSPVVLNNTLISESTNEALTAKQGSILKSELDDITTTANQHIGDTSNPHNVTKSQVGLSDVDNVKQATKTEFDAHNENNTIHVTETERTSWSNKAEKTYVDTKVSELVNSTQETLGEMAEVIQNTDDALDGLITTIGTKASSVDLTSHTDNLDIHITPTERTNWNNKAENTLATNTTNGLISNVEKVKLASISSGANFVEVLDDLTSTSTTSALSAGKGKVISDKIDILTSHTLEKVSSEDGSHGIRYFNNELSVFKNNQWVEIDTGGTSIPNVINFTGSSSNDGKQINLSWINPVSTEYIRTELYMSSTDISNLDLEQTQLVSQKVVNNNTSTSYTKPTQHGEQVFFKVYTVFTFLGSETHSKSNTLNIIATDSIPPSKVTNVQIKPSDGKLTISWTNPADLDFSSVRLNYSLNDDISSIDDGILLHNGSGNTVELDGLVNNIPVYLRFFTVDSNGNINDDVSMKHTGTPILGDDIWTGIGSMNLIAGDMQAGYFGRVPASELFTGTQLAQLVGITAGTAQHDTVDWLKFAYQGKILFRPMKAIRHTISWDNINSVGCVFGTKTVAKNGLTFKVRLMKGSSVDPAITANDATNTMKNSEWNKLMLPIHEQAATKTWAYPNFVESDVPNWGIGFTDTDLLTHNSAGNGSAVWCQEVYAPNTAYRVHCGYGGVSYVGYATSSGADAYYGWAPVLELVQGGA